MIMWIKWQNLATPARSLAARPPAYLASPRHAMPTASVLASAWPGPAGGGARVVWHSFGLFSASQLRWIISNHIS